MKKSALFVVFCFLTLTTTNFRPIRCCSCEPFSIEGIICKTQFVVLVLVTGVGPSTKTLDSFYVEIRQSFKVQYDAAKAFRDYGSGLVYTQRKFTSCALRMKVHELYLIYGHLNHRNQPMITYCTTLKYEHLTDEEKMNLNMVSIKGLSCKNITSENKF